MFGLLHKFLKLINIFLKLQLLLHTQKWRFCKIMNTYNTNISQEIY